MGESPSREKKRITIMPCSHFTRVIEEMSAGSCFMLFFKLSLIILPFVLMHTGCGEHFALIWEGGLAFGLEVFETLGEKYFDVEQADDTALHDIHEAKVGIINHPIDHKNVWESPQSANSLNRAPGPVRARLRLGEKDQWDCEPKLEGLEILADLRRTEYENSEWFMAFFLGLVLAFPTIVKLLKRMHLPEHHWEGHHDETSPLIKAIHV